MWHVCTCGRIPLLTSGNPLPDGSLCTYQVLARLAQSLPSYIKVTHRTLGYARGTTAREHVRVHTISDPRKTLHCRATRYIPNLGMIGPVVAEL